MIYFMEIVTAYEVITFTLIFINLNSVRFVLFLMFLISKCFIICLVYIDICRFQEWKLIKAFYNLIYKVSLNIWSIVSESKYIAEIRNKSVRNGYFFKYFSKGHPIPILVDIHIPKKLFIREYFIFHQELMITTFAHIFF